MSGDPQPAAWAVVPVKSFARGKSRLQNTLDAHSRAALARTMFEHVVDVLLRTPELAGVLVATDGDEVIELSQRLGARVLRDSRHEPRSLGRVVDAALDNLHSQGAALALVVMADLPRIQTADVQLLLSAATDADLVLAADQTGRCTNALVVQLQHQHPTSFGHPDSFAEHQRRAQALGLRVQVVHNARLAFDVDTPAELENAPE